MNMLEVVFPTIMYILGSISLVCLIVFIVKSIYTLDKVNEILDDVNGKVKSLDGLFNAINATSSAITAIGDSLIEKVITLFSKIGRKKQSKKRKEEDIDE